MAKKDSILIWLLCGILVLGIGVGLLTDPSVRTALAPAGDYDILVTAINAGADAVYISGERFGARAFAKNFTLEEIEKSVEYAHLNGAKIHVTVNTLINNFEVIDVVKYLFYLYKIGVDAVIVQDLGIIELIKNLIPGLEVHASTQMTLSDYDCILWAVENNISRIVFPREISVDKIAEISKKLQESNINMELEVFGHGALCYCFSGNCYISSYNSGRSGNRGACAQPCRKQYKLKYKNYNVGNGYLLSTHDLAVYKGLDKIEDAGVFSLKLEGRMKSADYVGTITNAYRHLIDGDEGDYDKDLSLVFNRQFTDGYILNQKPGQVLGRESSGHEGVYIGKITEKKGDLITIAKENEEFKINLDIGDGIGFKYKDKIKGIYIDNIKEQTDEEVENYFILIEKAINSKANIIIAPNGRVGNIIFRTLVLLNSWPSHGAITFGIDRVYIDTSRDQSIEGYVRSLTLAEKLSD